MIAGNDIISGDGKLLRSVLAAKIFNDASMLSRVEAEVFPAVMRDFYNWKARVEGSVRFVIIESAIFLAKPVLYPMADKVLYVDAPLELRIARVMRRDGIARDAVFERISNQPPVDLSKASWIIDTSLGQESIEKSVEDIVASFS